MTSADSQFDALRKIMLEFHSGAVDIIAVRDAVARTSPADLAALFASEILSPREGEVLARIEQDCQLIQSSPFQPGDSIGGRYLVKQIFRGGFGLVYICQQTGAETYQISGNMVALKTLLPRHLANPELRERFLIEASHCVALAAHPNLVLAYGVEEHVRLPFLILEYISGARTLQDEIEDGRTDWRVALQTGLGIARGLAFANLVHGDLKPVNILIAKDGAAKVADFGLSVSGTESEDSSILAGTRGFMAPEMFAGWPARTVATDIFAFGVTLFVTATRQLPHSLDPRQVLRGGVAPNPRQLIPDIPAAFANVITRCLDSDPSARPISFSQVSEELAHLHRSLLGTEPAAAPSPDSPANADALVNVAQTHLNLGRLAAALAAASEAVKADAQNWKAHNAVGLAQLANGRPAEALVHFENAVGLAPAESLAHANAALASWQCGEKEAAAGYFLEAAQLAHQSGRLGELDSISQLAIELLPEREAYNFIHAVLAENPAASLTWNNRSVLMRRMGAFAQALESAEQALALNPVYAKAYVQKANALLELKRWDEGLHAADRALALDGALAGAHCARFSALAALGRRKEAVAAIERGLSVLPENALLLKARQHFR